MNLEIEILLPLAGTGNLFAYHSANWWIQLKTAGAAIYANRHYLALQKKNLTKEISKNNCTIIGDVYIHPTACVDSSAVVSFSAQCLSIMTRKKKLSFFPFYLPYCYFYLPHIFLEIVSSIFKRFADFYSYGLILFSLFLFLL